MRALAAGCALRRRWNFYLHCRSNPGKYSSAFVPFGPPIGTIADFWGVYNALPVPSRTLLPPRLGQVKGKQLKAYSLFVEGVQPTWEDETNRAGGEVYCRCHMSGAAMDAMWLDTVLGCVGGTMEPERVVGVRVVDNTVKGSGATQSKIEVWYRALADPAEKGDILRNVRAALTAGPDIKFVHQDHEEKTRMEQSFMSTLKGAAGEAAGRRTPQHRRQRRPAGEAPAP
jgi:hypothetical protein